MRYARTYKNRREVNNVKENYNDSICTYPNRNSWQNGLRVRSNDNTTGQTKQTGSY